MKDEQRNNNKPLKPEKDASKTNQEATRDEQSKVQVLQTSAGTNSTSSWRRFFARKWVFPAVYMAAAAIILSIMWTIQNKDENVLSESDLGLTMEQSMTESEWTTEDDALPVTSSNETMIWPLENPNEIEVIRPFYEPNASGETKQAAMIEYENTFLPSMGVSLARQDNETFDVLAALSGTVVRAENHPLTGYIVEIEHADGLKTIYHSLSNVAVETGAEVIQGEVIAQAGRSEIGKDLGVHVHFEVHQDDDPINPELMLPPRQSGE